MPDVGQLKNGDVINYHWPDNTSCQDGFAVQHTVIVVDAASGPLIACHSPSHDNYPYYDLRSPCGYAAYKTYTTLFDSY